jgi:hypothetical protein
VKVEQFLHPGLLHFLVNGLCSVKECLHRHLRSYEPTTTYHHDLTLTYGDVVEHLAGALGGPAVNLPLLHIVEEVVLESVPAETLGARADSPAVLSIRIPPADIESVLSGLPDIVLKLLELLLAHHLAVVRIPHDTKIGQLLTRSNLLDIFDVGLHVLASILIQYESLHYSNYYY